MAGSISGKVFYDVNANNVLNPADSDFAFGGAPITLRDANGAAVGTTTADSNGQYGFDGIADGAYTVSFASPGNGLASSLPGSVRSATVSGGQAVTNVDSGYFLPALIAGQIFNDLDRDGVKEANEAFMVGVKVNLLDMHGNIVDTTTSVANDSFPGLYSFNVKPGSYQIQAVIPGEPLTQPLTPTGQLFGNQSLFYFNASAVTTPLAVGNGSIAGIAFLDADANAAQDSGEAGMVGVAVTLKTEAGRTVATTTSDAQGHYSFGSLPDGDYKVLFSAAGAFLADDGEPRSVAVANQAATSGVNAGFFKPASISGVVAIASTGAPLEGVTILLLDASGKVVATTTSGVILDGNNQFTIHGFYSFDNVKPGAYSVQAVIPNAVISPEASATIFLTSGQSTTSNIGIQSATVSGIDMVFGTAFADTNDNGQQDSGEATFANLVVTVKDASAAAVGSTITDAQGHYRVNGLTDGLYSVSFGAPAGGLAVTDVPVRLSAVQPFQLADGAFYSPATVSGVVFNDADSDGIAGSGEAGIAGVTVRLLGTDGATVGTTTTGSNGGYSFTGIQPGGYFVQFVTPSGDVATTPTKIDLYQLTAGQGVTANAGIHAVTGQVSLSGTAFLDANHNGLQDAGEAGLAHVNAVLVNNAGIAIQTAVTDASGHYSFTNVANGNYSVTFATPSGDVATTATTVQAGVLAAGQAKTGLDAGFAPDPSPNQTGGVPASTTLNIILRGQSNSQYFVQFGMLDKLKADIETMLGFDGVHQKVNLLATMFQEDGANTINSGTAVVGQWLVPIGGDYHNGWQATNLELGLLSAIARQPDDFKSGPTAVVWLHNETDTVNNPGMTPDQWESAARFEAGLVRGILGQSADTVPYLFVNAIPFPSNGILNGTNPPPANTATDQAIRVGMAALAADPNFNGQIAAQSSDVNMDANQRGAYGGAHNDLSDAQQLEQRLARSLADTFSASAQPGSPLAQAGGHIDNLGPQVISAATVAGHDDQLLLTIRHDAAVTLEALGVGAGQGLGWSLRGSAVGSDSALQASGVAVRIVDSTHLLVTFDNNVQAGSKLFYAWGSARIAPDALPGIGNAVYDNNHLPIWADANGVGVTNSHVAVSSTISGVAFLDANGSHLADNDEAGLGGLAVTLKDSFGATVGITTTDQHGAYSFAVATSGTYSVTFTPPAGAPLGGGTENQTVIVGSNQNLSNINAGFYAPVMILGLTFDDSAGIGQPTSAGFLNGIEVDLLNAAGTVVASTLSSSNNPLAPGQDGVYSFDNLAPGSYSVRFIATAGNTVTTLAVNNLGTLTSGQQIEVDGGIAAAVVSIDGTVFTDANGNNLLDGGEAVISGDTVTLKNASGAIVGTTMTNPLGHYSFTGLAAGVYTVNATTPSGKLPNSATPLSVTVADQAVTGRNVGFYTPAQIAGFVFADTNHNNTQEGSESFLDGVTVNLLDMSGNIVATTVSAPLFGFPHGVYSFSVKPGSYQIQTVVSDETLSQPLRPTGALVGGQTLFFFNIAAAVTPASITGSIFNDVDRNGHQDTGEGNIAGVAVMAITGAGTPQATVTAATTTDAQGHYTLNGLAAGTYQVVAASPSGDLPTISQTLTVGPIAKGGVGQADFGFAADPTPNAAPLPGVTTVNIIVRGQSNITYFTQDGYLAQLKTAIERALGFDGVHQVVNFLADNATLHPGTGLLRDWLSPVNGDYRNGWAANDIEKQFLSDVASQSAAFKAAPTLVLWLHNESDSLVPGVTSDEWMSAARFEAGLVRAALGQSADSVPYLFVNAIPFLQAGSITQAQHDAVEQNIKIGMAALAADPVFNARIVAQLADVTMDRDGAINGAHLNATDNQALLDRLSRSIADVLTASAQPGSPLAQAGGHIASAGPQVISAAVMAGHPDQLLITVQHDGATGFTTLDPDAAAGVGWSIRNNASGADSVLEASATHVQIVDGTHLLITFDHAAPIDGKLFYAWGANRLAATTALPGNGNAVYDTNNLPISADPNGVGVTGAAPPVTGGGSITGTVFLDGNANNLLDGSDAGIVGVAVTLKDANGITIGTTSSDAQGQYNFTSLAAGTYTVNVTTPSGKVGDSATPLSVPVAANAVTGQNVGFFTPATIAGFAFTDSNGNGTLDGNENPIDGIAVNLVDSTGHLVASTVSAANPSFPHGVYQFDNVKPGTYTVQPVATGAASHATGPIVGGQALYGLHVGVPAAAPGSAGSIFGYAFNDLNGNGKFESGEALVNGETVELLNFNRDPVASTVTGPGAPLASISTFEGAFAFANVTPGSYYVRFTAPDGKVLTTPVISSVGSLSGGQSVNINSGVISSAGTITVSGNAFDDTNGNGHRDSGEAGHAGVDVLLVKDAGTATAVAVKTIVTDADGHYSFNALPAGTYSVVFSTPSGLESTSPTTVSAGALVTGQSANASAGFHVDPTPNAAPLAPTTVINIILRGQSNAQNFSGQNSYLNGPSAIDAMKTQLEQLLGFDGVHQRINIIDDVGKPDGANTINSGTGMLTDWLSPIGGDYHNGWTAKNLELGLLSDLAQHAADLRAGPTAVVWLHNEHDSNNPSITTDMWTSAVRYEAGLVRALLGQDAGSVPYLFVNAIPFPNSDNGDQTIKIGMSQLAADPVFNARIAAQLADIDETEFGTAPLGGHINSQDRLLLAGRLAESLAQTFASSAMPGSPIALAGGQVDDLGPQVVEARAVAGHANQVMLTIHHDSATGFESLDPDAAAGIGWSIRSSAISGSLQASGTAAQIIDPTHLLVTFDQNVPVNGKVFYAWGAGLIAQPSQGGFGNAVYDNNHMPIWVDPSGLGLAGAASVTGIVASGLGIVDGSGRLKAGAVITFTAIFDTSVTVDTTQGAPMLALSDGGVATYTSGSGTSKLVFSSTVGAGENSTDIAVTGFNLHGATVHDSGGNDAGLSGAATNPMGTLVIDTTKPVISVTPPAGHVEAVSPAGAAVAFAGAATDNIDGTDPVVFKEGNTVIASGHVFGMGAHTVAASATDLAGNIADTVLFNFTVSDSTKPLIEVIAPPAHVEATSRAGAVVIFAASATDHIDSADPVVLREGNTVVASGQVFGIGAHTVTASATDAAGNAADRVSFGFEVSDTIKPVVSVTPPAAHIGATSPTGAVVTFQGAATDNIDGADPVVFREGTTIVTPGQVFGIGAHTIVASAADAAGNTAVPLTFGFTVDSYVPTPVPNPSSPPTPQAPVLSTGPTPFVYQMYGVKGADLFDHFDQASYVKAHPDLAAAHIDPFEYFLQHDFGNGQHAWLA